MVDFKALLAKSKEKADADFQKTKLNSSGGDVFKSIASGNKQECNEEKSQEAKQTVKEEAKTTNPLLTLWNKKTEEIKSLPGEVNKLGNDRAAGYDSIAPGGDIVAKAVSPPVISAEVYNHTSQPDKLPEGDVQAFKDNLEILRNSFDQKELVGAAIKNVLQSLKENPQFRNVLAPEDIGLMVRALRQSYGFVVSDKSNKREKKQKKEENLSEINQALAGISFNLG